MEFLQRIRSAMACIFFGHVSMPLNEFSTIAIGEEALILCTEVNPKSIEVALWALERPEHYWRATSVGVETHKEAAGYINLKEESSAT